MSLRTDPIPDAKTLGIKRPASTAQAKGDLMFWDGTYAQSAATRADTGSLAGNQRDFAPIFCGVNQDVRLATETDTPFRVVETEGVAEASCASTTWAIGDLVGIDRDGTPLNYNQQVAKVTDPNAAIGVCILAGAGLTTVRFKFKSKLLNGSGSGGNPIQGVATGYKIARGQHTMLSAVDTVVTGLATVVSVVASMESDPVLTFDRVTAQVGDQAGTPAAGSVILKGWMPTDATHTTPIAATGFAGIKVNWIAIGT